MCLNYKLFILIQFMDITEYFNLPIDTISNKVTVDKNIITDLELIEDNEDGQNILSYIFNPTNDFSKITQNMWCKYQTTDINFLKQSQNLYKTFKITSLMNNDYLTSIYDKYISYKTDTGFKEKYGFMDWSHLEFLNNWEYFLLIFAVIHILSPIFSLILPIIFLLFPYIILLIQGHPITIDVYIRVLTDMFRNTSLVRLVTGDFSDFKQASYFVMTILMYGFQIYSNILTCIRFHYNLDKLHVFMGEMTDYIEWTTKNMDIYWNNVSDLDTYANFRTELDKHNSVLKRYLFKINKIQSYSWNFTELFNLGYIQKNFYSIYNDDELHRSLMYSFGFHGYIDNIVGIQKNIKEKNINFCTFNKKKNTKFTKAYFCNNQKPVKNTYELNKKYIVTGPNASGKTTLLKTSLLNIVISQQIGCGFYKKANINPYKYIHCYLNIPDTTGRDSLFQAEARRCKEIIEVTKKNKERHFCIFDELYSGTNPYEAEASSHSFINYLSQLNNVDFMMTTHLIKLCENIDKKSKIINYNMKTIPINKYDFKYTYLLKKGISKIKGAVKVLKELDYPPDIIDATLEYLK